MKKRILSIIMTMVVCVTGLSGCAHINVENDEKTTAIVETTTVPETEITTITTIPPVETTVTTTTTDVETGIYTEDGTVEPNQRVYSYEGYGSLSVNGSKIDSVDYWMWTYDKAKDRYS